jgi:F-type H+-transporting ATPase subunit a
MDRLHASRLAITALLLGAALFASAPALAQDHGAQDHGHATEQTHDAGHAADAHAADAHAADAHATDAHAADAHGDPHGEDAHGEDAHMATGHGDEHGDAHGAHGDDHGGHGAMPHLPNALTFIKAWVPAPVAAKLDAFLDPIFSLTMALLLALFFVSLSKSLDSRKPGRAQMAIEMIFGGLYSLFSTIIGDTARRYTPYLGSLFLFIFCNNLFGLIPLGHAATSSFANTTFALGTLTFLYVQGIALKENGIGGYLHHLAGSPHTTLDWCLVPLFFPLHLIGELIKPLSLSLRLFGNIFGEDTLVATMVLLGAGMLSSTIQALVFTLLSTVYIALWLPHGHHDEAHGH